MADKPTNTFEANRNRQLAVEAGQKRVCLSLRYDGKPRVVEVQVVGTSLKNRPAMRVYQVEPQSNPAPSANFRLLCFDECFSVALSNRQAAPPRSNKNNRDEGFTRIEWAYV
ncbi:hypothetical protein ACOYW6_01490 [Parablastomonas sp. CN1-191]|uniref:hypothetical protein n=1 Tax=Parablastomonas sp. CN1-191 TaxID=3400908 RepID=UPI003BF872C8